MSKEIYNDSFFDRHTRGAYRSAKKIVPLVIEVARPASVIDVGCGLGAWLKAFEENGIDDFLGIDGEYVKEEKLLIAKEKFAAMDLTNSFRLDRKFDLAVCLEVAEHIEEKNAKSFIKSLVNLSDVIVFSAAIPCQTGTRHVNEKWPSYWRRLFLRYDYEMLDPFRMRIINDDEIKWWYRQNIFLAVKKDLLDDERFKNMPRFSDEFFIINKRIFKWVKFILDYIAVIKTFLRID